MSERSLSPSSNAAASWIANATRWTKIVRSGGVASRTLGTDDAILAAVCATAPKDVLDLGCGEGWLARQLAARDIRVVGTDASPALVAAAQRAGGGTFHHLDYAAIAAGTHHLPRGYDVIVANFSLLDEDLAGLLTVLPDLLRADGVLIIQTLHPSLMAPPYQDGWRLETFEGFGADKDWMPMPWYFRTVGSWHALLSHRWSIIRIDEPVHPGTGRPLSLLMTLRAQTDRRAA